MKRKICLWTPALLLCLLLAGCVAAKRSHRQEAMQTQSLNEAAAVAGKSVQFKQNYGKQTQEALRRTTFGMTEEAIPARQTRLSLPIPSLLDLPDGAGYASRSGRAALSVRRSGDSLLVVGQCDSIARRCLFLSESLEERRHEADSLRSVLSRQEREIATRDSLYRAEMAVKEEKSRSSFGWGDMIMAFITGLAAGAVFTFIKITK